MPSRCSPRSTLIRDMIPERRGVYLHIGERHSRRVPCVKSVPLALGVIAKELTRLHFPSSLRPQSRNRAKSLPVAGSAASSRSTCACACVRTALPSWPAAHDLPAVAAHCPLPTALAVSTSATLTHSMW